MPCAKIQLLIALTFITCCDCYSQIQILDGSTHYLRSGETREWAEFPLVVNDKQLSIEFQYHAQNTGVALSVRQYDVKQNWRILINGQDIGGLVKDEKDMIVYFDIPENILKDGNNRFQIKTNDATSDDINVRDILIHYRSVKSILSPAAVTISVVESENGKSDKGIPSRITVVTEDGSLQTIDAKSNSSLAIRPGYVYTSNGEVNVTLPAGKYTFFAGRGFEYSVDSIHLELKPGDQLKRTLKIKREVNTSGWVSSDTHVHTFTFSRHGDSSIEERALTIAGEGIELPIMTDHNQNIDIGSAASKVNVSGYFTPVTGNELTTKVGHFNLFRTSATDPAISAECKDWNDVSRNIGKDNQYAVVLNHARDIHNGFRPFDPSHHLSSSGTIVNGWKFPANAMEIINSGSQQSDVTELFRDWMGMLNHGYHLTPVGSSDSHDVTRYIVGQGRTYIEASDGDPSLDVDQAIKSFKEGKVLVSLGLLAKIDVDGIGPGGFVKVRDYASVTVEVMGPSWAKAEKLSLYMNGIKIKEENITTGSLPGTKWKAKWRIPVPDYDVFLVALAEGDGSGMPYWPIAKPYQPVSIEWQPRLIGATGEVYIDGDRNGTRSSAYDYALALFKKAGGDPIRFISLLSSYDESIAIQAGAILWENSKDLNDPGILRGIQESRPEIKRGLDKIFSEIKLIK